MRCHAEFESHSAPAPDAGVAARGVGMKLAPFSTSRNTDADAGAEPGARRTQMQ